ncbi:WxL domain-containing protein [Listeria aquatica]|uniref:WxL domain-containing protein n=1 Tax=Listeria aquatica TaxID=1494960 RepID=UPI003F6EBA7E
MKLVKWTIAPIAAVSVLATSSLPALAAEEGSIQTYQSNGSVEFIPSSDQTDPVDPNNPDPNNPVKPIDPTDPEGPNPGTKGPLSIDYASSLDFGVNKITNNDETYYAKAQELNRDKDRWVPNYVQISDHRGTNAGWTLTVRQEGQFKNDTTQNKVLTGSVISFTDPKAASNMEGVTTPKVTEITLDPEGAESLVMSAKANVGAGTWVDHFGHVEEMTDDQGQTVQKTKAISLTVPGKTPKDAVKYSTKLTWKLTDVPENN